MKKGILYFGIILGFSMGIISCSTDAYDVQNEKSTLEVVSPLANKDGDGVVEEGDTNEAAEEEEESTDPIVKPKKD